jgi:hypothetical protein
VSLLERAHGSADLPLRFTADTEVADRDDAGRRARRPSK